MPTNTHINDLPYPLDANVTTTTTSTVSPSPYPSNPPAAMTVILSIACGIVATCILLTLVVLLLRHRSSKQAFRQGQQQQQQQHQHTRHASSASNSEPNLKSHVNILIEDDGSGSRNAPDTDSEDHELAMYLPVLLHGSSTPPSTQQPNTKQTEMRLTTSDRRGCGLGRASSPAYPHAAYLGSEASARTRQ